MDGRRLATSSPVTPVVDANQPIVTSPTQERRSRARRAEPGRAVGRQVVAPTGSGPAISSVAIASAAAWVG